MYGEHVVQRRGTRLKSTTGPTSVNIHTLERLKHFSKYCEHLKSAWGCTHKII